MTGLTITYSNFIVTAVVGVALGIWLASIGYALYALGCVLGRGKRVRVPGALPAVTILKPLCGLEPGLSDNLRSFCRQDYDNCQIVFGLRAADDPARGVAELLVAEFPERDISVVVDPRTFGSNLKVSNIMNMMARAKHDFIVVADSDMRVGPDYLSAVVAEFGDPKVGAATCLYRAKALGGIAARLGAMFINQWFLPSVLVALSFRELRFCFGATMAVRRSALDAIGGFGALARYLADDHLLGQRVAEAGFRVALSPYMVETVASDRDLSELWRHELRWARTVRSIEPLGYALSFVTYLVPMSILVSIALELSGDWDTWGQGFIAVAVATRIVMHFSISKALAAGRMGDFWLAPIRDILSFAVWLASFFGRDVRWKNENFAVETDGRLTAKESFE